MPTTRIIKKSHHTLDQVAQNHESLVVTKYNKPMVKIVPYEETKDNGNKPLKGLATFVGDVFSPIDEEWEADQ